METSGDLTIAKDEDNERRKEGSGRFEERDVNAARKLGQ
jgi:hypothetical protein